MSVIVPVRNEAERLPACLEAIAAQDVPPEWMEVLVVDGGSDDGTAEVVRRLLADRPWAGAGLLHSAVGDRSSNLNVGLESARGAVVVRVDGRSRIPAHYLGRCLELLERRPDVAVVGGRQRAVAPADRPPEVGMARALNNRWGMGLARYRRAAESGESDTVYLGAYRTDQLRAAGGWRTDLAVNEDFDLNRRLRRFGTVWFDAGLAVDYVPRSSLPDLSRQYWVFGLGKARYWRVSGDRPRPRQVVLLAGSAVAASGFVAVLAALGPAAAGLLVAAGLAAGTAVEVAGADGPAGGFRAHAVGLAALACAAGAWLAGVAVGTVRAAPPPAPARHQEKPA